MKIERLGDSVVPVILARGDHIDGNLTICRVWFGDVNMLSRSSLGFAVNVGVFAINHNCMDFPMSSQSTKKGQKQDRE